MPFVSQAQRRFFYAKAKEDTEEGKKFRGYIEKMRAETPKGKKLPERVGSSGKRVSGYTRKDGTVVRGYTRGAKKENHVAQRTRERSPGSEAEVNRLRQAIKSMKLRAGQDYYYRLPGGGSAVVGDVGGSKRPRHVVKTVLGPSMTPRGVLLKHLPVSKKDIHTRADQLGILWDSNKPGSEKFLALSKRITGKAHLDDMSPKELKALFSALRPPKEKTAAGILSFFRKKTPSEQAAKKLKRIQRIRAGASTPSFVPTEKTKIVLPTQISSPAREKAERELAAMKKTAAQDSFEYGFFLELEKILSGNNPTPK